MLYGKRRSPILNKLLNTNTPGQHSNINIDTVIPISPALNISAQDSDKSILVSTNQEINAGPENSFMEKMKMARETLAANGPKYGRKEACTLVGFPGNTKAFTGWLRDNNFLCYDDSPEYSLMERGLMDVHQKNIYKTVRYDCSNVPISGSEYDVGEILKSVYTPLFTERGIGYFKTLVADKNLLQVEVEKIKLINQLQSNQN